MTRHWKTEGNVYSLCELTGEADVYVSGESVTGMQPNDYCSACREVEPEWIHLDDEEYFELEKKLY